jgi:hypothetical protein
LRTNGPAFVGRVEDELGEGEVVWDVGKRVPRREKFSHGGREGEEKKGS